MRRNGRDSKQLPLLSETHTVSESSQSIGRESRSSETCGLSSGTSRFRERSQGNLLETVSLSSPADSPRGSLANLIPLQESVRRLVTLVTSGPSLPVSFARFIRDGSSQKMSLVSSQVSLDGSLGPFCGTWPRWGIARDGACGELATLELSTVETASSSWPTPDAMVANLNEAVESVLARRARVKETAGNGNGFGLRLTSAVKMWPTPTSLDHKDGTSANGRTDLLGQACGPGKESGSLNPRWVEWLVGFPPNWTEVK